MADGGWRMHSSSTYCGNLLPILPHRRCILNETSCTLTIYSIRASRCPVSVIPSSPVWFLFRFTFFCFVMDLGGVCPQVEWNRFLAMLVAHDEKKDGVLSMPQLIPHWWAIHRRFWVWCQTSGFLSWVQVLKIGTTSPKIKDWFPSQKVPRLLLPTLQSTNTHQEQYRTFLPLPFPNKKVRSCIRRYKKSPKITLARVHRKEY